MPGRNLQAVELNSNTHAHFSQRSLKLHRRWGEGGGQAASRSCHLGAGRGGAGLGGRSRASLACLNRVNSSESATLAGPVRVSCTAARHGEDTPRPAGRPAGRPILGRPAGQGAVATPRRVRAALSRRTRFSATHAEAAGPKARPPSRAVLGAPSGGPAPTRSDGDSDSGARGPARASQQPAARRRRRRGPHRQPPGCGGPLRCGRGEGRPSPLCGAGKRGAGAADGAYWARPAPAGRLGRLGRIGWAREGARPCGTFEAVGTGPVAMVPAAYAMLSGAAAAAARPQQHPSCCRRNTLGIGRGLSSESSSESSELSEASESSESSELHNGSMTNRTPGRIHIRGPTARCEPGVPID